MKKIFLILFTIILFAKSYGQYFPYKAPSKNIAWIDSMKRIVQKGFVLNRDEKNNWKKQLAFVKTCALFGRYYEWAYEKHHLKNMQQALKYYNIVIDLERFPENELYFEALAIRTNIYRKLEDIYFKGKGVKKNKQLSLSNALHGIGWNKKLYKFYSLRYFNTTNIFLDSTKYLNTNRDSVFVFIINPFALKLHLFSINNFRNKLIFFKDKFAVDFQKKSVFIEIEMNCYPSASSQSDAHYFLKKIEEWFLANTTIPIENIIKNLEVNEDVGYLKITVIKN